MKQLVLISFLLPLFVFSQKRDSIRVKNDVFEVIYSEIFEQPLWVEYTVRDIVKNADRKGMDFYTNDSIHTSDKYDYINNRWYKGHMAPAASFYDTEEKLKKTFSYLNCSLQHYKLNRGEWRMLESQEKVWAKSFGPLIVQINLKFDEGHEVLPTGGHIPTGYIKHIIFGGGRTECFYFPNEEPIKESFLDYKIKCIEHCQVGIK